MTTSINKPSTISADNVHAIHKRPQDGLEVNSGLYHRFLEWKLKCENILDCELAMLPDSKQCKKVRTWSGDFGMEQYVSWCLPAAEINVNTIWTKFEEFCKPQASEVWARFDMLTSFCQDNRSVGEWYNAIQDQVSLANYPQETTNILHHDIFWFFWKMKNLCPRSSMTAVWTLTSSLQAKSDNL